MERLIRVMLLVGVCYLFPQLAQADLVINSLAGNVYSEFDTASDADASTQLTIFINSNVAANNSFTNSSANWDWNEDTLTGASLITAEKTVSARPGGEHRGTSGLVFEFELTSEADFALGGSWGLVNPSGTDDSIRFELVGPDGVVASDVSTGTTGVNSNTFAMAFRRRVGRLISLP